MVHRDDPLVALRRFLAAMGEDPGVVDQHVDGSAARCDFGAGAAGLGEQGQVGDGNPTLMPCAQRAGKLGIDPIPESLE